MTLNRSHLTEALRWVIVYCSISQRLRSIGYWTFIVHKIRVIPSYVQVQARFIELNIKWQQNPHQQHNNNWSVVKWKLSAGTVDILQRNWGDAAIQTLCSDWIDRDATSHSV